LSLALSLLHITRNRAMYGSDQTLSIKPFGFQ